MLQIQDSENLNILFSNLLIEELVRLNVLYYCISPGSRSAPLTIAADRHKKTQTKIVYDERGAAFHALGYARATKKAAVLICSSGTAAANYYPAVIEAFQENLPMIVLSADRPVELRNTGANQTINQVDLFGKYTKYFIDLPGPENTKDASFILNIIDDAYSAATAIDAGPVHINCPFREPLSPNKLPWPDNYLSPVKLWLKSSNPYKYKPNKYKPLMKSDLSFVTNIFNKSTDGIILCGRNENQEDLKAILKLAENIRWPIFADITSGLKLNPSPAIIHHFDSLLMDETLSDKLLKLPIIHFSGQFVSKRLLQFLEKFQGEHVHISETSKKIDPAKSVCKHIIHPPHKFIEKLLLELNRTRFSNLLAEVILLNKKVNHEIISFLESTSGQINEISIINLIIENIIRNSSLFISSSMPIRDMDKFALPLKKTITIGANRGASGIDGTIASAIGFALGSKKPTTLLIGDLAFLHDQSSLAMLNNLDIPITIILINNQGGGIFSFLPIAEYKDVFEKNFATPHNLSFKNLAEQFGLNYFTPITSHAFVSIYRQAQTRKIPTLIEIKSDREQNYQFHKQLDAQIKSKLL